MRLSEKDPVGKTHLLLDGTCDSYLTKDVSAMIGYRHEPFNDCENLEPRSDIAVLAP